MLSRVPGRMVSKVASQWIEMEHVRQVVRRTSDNLTVWEAVCRQIHRQAGRPAGWQTRIKAGR